MQTNHKIRAILGSLGVTLLIALPPAHAEDDLSPSTELKLPANWELRRDDETNAVELTSRVSAGAFSTMCSGDSCGVFVEPVSGCVPGAKYPLLINSAKQVGVIPTKCAAIPGAKDGEVRLVVLLQEEKALIKAMMEETDLTIAFPTQAGQMDVLDVKMAGVRNALRQMVPGLSDESGDDSNAAKTASMVRAQPEHSRI